MAEEWLDIDMDHEIVDQEVLPMLDENWEQMAERLGVEVGLAVSSESAFMKGNKCVLFCRVSGKISPCPYGQEGEALSSQQARDLADCLQVAARYLEEVGTHNDQ